MAGDWIKMRTDLANDPAVIAIAAQVGVGEDEVVGKLHKLWSWADQHTVDGNARSVPRSFLERYLGVPKFVDAMVEQGWLTITEAGVSIPNFARHNGESAKKRALTNDRKIKFKERKQRSQSVPREEKRREEETTPTPRVRRANGHQLPADWVPLATTSERLATELKLDAAAISRYHVWFRDYCTARGKVYKNFDAAFANCVRSDWPHYRGRDGGVLPPPPTRKFVSA